MLWFRHHSVLDVCCVVQFHFNSSKIVILVSNLFQDSGYVLLLKKSLKKLFEENKMIAVVQNSASSAEDMTLLKHRLFKHGITVKFIPNQVNFYLF